MQLITKEIEKRLAEKPLYSTDGQNKKEVICKFFNPCGAGTWYVFEGEKQEDGNWLFFGLVDLMEKELGYFSLDELKSVKLPFGATIERDLHFENYCYDITEDKFEQIKH